MAGNKLLVYLLRRDLRVSDNPILHHLATSTDHGFTHLLPVYVFPPHQIEVSGLLAEGKSSPYPPARSQVGKFWRCGPHRAKFITESVWDVKKSFESLNSVLVLRVGSFPDVLKQIVDSFKDKQQNVSAVWMTDEQSDEEIQEQDAVSSFCSQNGLDFKIWGDEKYYIDDRDNGLKHPSDLPDIFTTYRKQQEPLRDRPRASLPAPSKLLPPPDDIPPQQSPFVIPDSYQEFETKLLKPLNNILDNTFPYPPNASSAHPFKGGETKAWGRVRHLIQSGSMTDYKETRNGLVGADFSTKLSAYLALGSITARQVHEELVKLEDGQEPEYKDAKGYNKGENEGTKAVRFELLWRDYMRLCSMKFGPKLFRLAGFRQAKDHDKKKWKTTDKDKAPADQDPSPEDAKLILNRFLEGRTGMGLIDASQRELYHTGYTSNRARQNVASFLSKHLYLDWRYGAEWYEMLLVDYDVSSNWSNWQYVAGVGNDPRGDARIFNPVKQAFDYDKNGTYVRTWVPELKDLEKLENVFQVWTTSPEDLEKHGLTENQMVTDPIKKIDFTVERKPRGPRGPHRWRRGGRGGQRSGWNESGGGFSPGSSGGGNSGASSGGRANTAPGGRGQHNTNSNRKEGEMHQRHHSQQQRYDNAHVPRSMNNQYGGYNDGQSGYSNGYHNGYPNGGYNGYPNGSSDGYSYGYSNGFVNQYPGPGTRGGWTGQSRGTGWRGSGRGGGRGFRRGYNNYIQHVAVPQGYAAHPSYPQPQMGPV